MAVTYQIRSGDSLSLIAARNHTTVKELAQANGITDPNKIRAGDTLTIPHRHSTEPVTPESRAPERSPLPRPRPQRPLGTDTVSLTTAPGLSARDTESLIRAVAAEARGESPAVWAAVAQTILNYAKQNNQSISRLVRTSYLSSNFDGNRIYYRMPMSRIPNLDGIRNAVNQAAQGQSPIGDRLHFHDTSIRTPSFGDRNTRLQIGSMVFFNPK